MGYLNVQFFQLRICSWTSDWFHLTVSTVTNDKKIIDVNLKKKITWYIITYIIVSHHSTLYKFIYQTQQNKYLTLTHWNIFFIYDTVDTICSKTVCNIKFYTKWWTPKFTSVKCGPEHVFSGLNQTNQHLIWWFIAHIVGSDWSQTGVHYTRESWEADYLTLHGLHKTKSLLWWRQFSTQADSQGISSFFESCSTNVSTWSSSFWHDPVVLTGKLMLWRQQKFDNWLYLIGDGHKDARVGAGEDRDLAFLWQQNLAALQSNLLPLL